MNSIDLLLAAKEMQDRRKARTGLHDFITYLNPEFIVSDFSRECCAALDTFLDDVIAGKRPILVLAAPPQHGKSEIVSRYFPAYAFGRLASLRIGGLSYASTLAKTMNKAVQRIMLTNEYRNLFPESSLRISKGSRDDVDPSRSSYEFDVGKTGFYVGQGVGGPLTGRPLDIGIIDDPIKNAKEALSPTIKKGVWDWYVSTFLTRLSKNSGQIIMATRWAQDDLSGKVLAKYKRAKQLIFQAIDSKGRALVPELHPIEKLLETKDTLGDYFWSAMYQQSPKAAGGTIIKDSHIQYYLPKDLPAKFERIIQSWDMTFKDTDGSDYVVGQVWGKLGARAYKLDEVRDRMSFTATVAAVKRMSEKWPQATRKLIEDKANGPAVIDNLKTTIPGLIPIEPDGSKIARCHAVSTYWEAGNVWLPHKDIAPWIEDAVTEYTTFPAAANDDRVDAMTQALRDLFGKKRGFFG